MENKKYLPNEYKNIAKLRGKLDDPMESIPVRSSSNLTSEAAPQVQKTISGNDFKAKIEGLRAMKALPALNLLGLPFSAADAQEQRPGDAVGQAGIMAGIPEEQLPKTEDQYFEELRRRMNQEG